MIHSDEILRYFNASFGPGEQAQLFFAPGRVNLIGEHIDYNGGDVLPFAIQFGTTAAVRKRSDNKVRLASIGKCDSLTYELDQIIDAKAMGHWSDYPVGCIQFLQKQGIVEGGFEIAYGTDLPMGAGLSSSAAFEVLTMFALRSLFKAELDLTRIAVDSREVEHSFVGMPCGIMDQFAVARAIEAHALKLNCDTLDFEHIPLDLPGYSILVIDSGKDRELTGSEYAERRAACETALEIIQRNRPHIKHLVQADLNDLNVIENDIIRKRAMHVVSEQIRVESMAIALRSSDIHSIGRILQEGHRSLKDEFEVSCEELDHLVAESCTHPACAGARMTGAGFGGCAIAIVKSDRVQEFRAAITKSYRLKFSKTAIFYPVKASSGVMALP